MTGGRAVGDAGDAGGGSPGGAADPVLVVAIGGVDPGGGAGVIRDFLTALARGARARVVPTAWTAQSPRGVSEIEPREVGALSRAVRAAIARSGESGDDRVDGGDRAGDGDSGSATGRTAVKIGMLVDGPSAEAVARALGDFRGPVVLDPVLAASSGGALYAGDPTRLATLFSGATLMTPNAAEAAALVGFPVASADDAERAGRTLVSRGVRAVLVKGGHLGGAAAVDVLVTAAAVHRFSVARVPGPSVRGTGCALATAIAVELARGRSLRDAVDIAKAWLAQTLTQVIDVGAERHLS